jgi:hypothetical protein
MFLPEADQEFLAHKGLRYELKSELPGDERRAIEFPDFEVPANLARRDGAALVPGGTARLLVLVPTGYAKVKLDSWYTFPRLYLLDGREVDRATGSQDMFGVSWQFWSRHLTDAEWRADVDGLETYLQYIRAGLKEAR